MTKKPYREKYTVTEMAQAIRDTSGLITYAAEKLGCSPMTVRRYIDKYPTVKQALTDARARFVDMAEAKLLQAVNRGDPWAVALVVRSLGKDRGYTERQEMTGQDGNEIVFRVVRE